MKTLIRFIMIFLLIAFTTTAYAGRVTIEDTTGVARGIKIAPDGSLDTNVQDQTTRMAALRFSLIDDLTMTLAEIPVVDQYDITLTAGHSVAPGESLSIIYDEPGHVRGSHFMTAEVLSVATNVLTLDEPVPYAFPVESIMYTSTQNMAVDGSVVGGGRVIFGITNAYATPVDVTQVIFHITDNAAMDDALFGGISRLTRGVVLRVKYANGGHYENFMNIKRNGGFGEISGPEFKEYDSKAPSGVYGYTVKISFSGQGNFGAVMRLHQGDSVQLLIQDDIDALLTFTGMLEGHFTN